MVPKCAPGGSDLGNFSMFIAATAVVSLEASSGEWNGQLFFMGGVFRSQKTSVVVVVTQMQLKMP